MNFLLIFILNFDRFQMIVASTSRCSLRPVSVASIRRKSKIMKPRDYQFPEINIKDVSISYAKGSIERDYNIRYF